MSVLNESDTKNVRSYASLGLFQSPQPNEPIEQWLVVLELLTAA